MIVRILGEGQFEVAEADSPKLDALEAALNAAVDGDDDATFTSALTALIEEVRSVGTPLAPDELSASDLVVPFSDATLSETRTLLDEPGGERT